MSAQRSACNRDIQVESADIFGLFGKSLTFLAYNARDSQPLQLIARFEVEHQPGAVTSAKLFPGLRAIRILRSAGV